MKHVLLISILLLTLSCRKDIGVAPKVTPETIIIAGAKPSSVSFTDIIPDTLLVGSTYSIYKKYWGGYMNAASFKFSNIHYYHFALSHTVDNNYIETMNSDSYILCDSIYPSITTTGTVVSHVIVNALYPKILSINDTIKLKGKWRSGKQVLSLYSVFPTFYNQEGYWSGSGEKYIGVRYKNYLGWIKISVPSNGVKIFEYAFTQI